MLEQWLEARRAHEGLPWPHTWKRRKKEVWHTPPRATARGTDRDALRRASAQGDSFDYNEAATQRRKRVERPEAAEGEGGTEDGTGTAKRRRGALKFMIRMGPLGLQAVEEGAGGRR